MKQIISILLFLLQCFCIVIGSRFFGSDGNPIVLLASSLGIAIIYLQLLQSGRIGFETSNNNTQGKLIGALTVIVSLPLCYYLFNKYEHYSTLSDVLPQLDALYTRYAAGKFPYYPLEEYSWHPFPVYMPLNWLPLGIAHICSADIRWVGIAAIIMASMLWGGYVWRIKHNTYLKIGAILFPALALYIFMTFLSKDMSVSLETLIAGYYMILAIGLLSERLYLIAIGLILCLLSRYTLVFWLPLFAVLFWQKQSLKSNMLLWSSVIVAIVFIYIIPFYSKDPSILTKGIVYHNGCAIAEWYGYGESRTSNTFLPGVYFAHYYKNLLTGSIEEKVMITRIVQAVLMIVLNIVGLYYYNKNKHRLDYEKFAMVMLYLFVMIFYMFSPLLYRYYYIVPLSLSAMLCGQILLAKRDHNITTNHATQLATESF